MKLKFPYSVRNLTDIDAECLVSGVVAANVEGKWSPVGGDWKVSFRELLAHPSPWTTKVKARSQIETTIIVDTPEGISPNKDFLLLVQIKKLVDGDVVLSIVGEAIRFKVRKPGKVEKAEKKIASDVAKAQQSVLDAAKRLGEMYDETKDAVKCREFLEHILKGSKNFPLEELQIVMNAVTDALTDLQDTAKGLPEFAFPRLSAWEEEHDKLEDDYGKSKYGEPKAFRELIYKQVRVILTRHHDPEKWLLHTTAENVLESIDKDLWGSEDSEYHPAVQDIMKFLQGKVMNMQAFIEHCKVLTEQMRKEIDELTGTSEPHEPKPPPISMKDVKGWSAVKRRVAAMPKGAEWVPEEKGALG